MGKAYGFDRQKFVDARQWLPVDKRAVEYVVMDPDVTQRYYERRTLILVPGFLCRLSNVALLGHELTRYGNRVIPTAHTRPDEHPSGDIKATVEAYYDGRFGVPGGRPTLVVHSLAAINTAECLSAYPELVSMIDGVVELAPAGYGGVSPLSAPLSVATELLHRPSTPAIRNAVEDALQYMHTSGIEMLRLAKHASTANICEQTRQLIGNDLPVAALVAKRDRLIKYQPLTAGLGKAAVVYKDIQVAKAGHNAHLLFPEETAADVVAQIERLDNHPAVA